MKKISLSAFLLLSISLTLNAMEDAPEIQQPEAQLKFDALLADFWAKEGYPKEIVCPVRPIYKRARRMLTQDERDYFQKKTDEFTKLFTTTTSELFSQLFEVYDQTLPSPPSPLCKQNPLEELTHIEILQGQILSTQASQYPAHCAIKRYKDLVIKPEKSEEDLEESIEELMKFKDHIRYGMITNLIKGILEENEVDTLLDPLLEQHNQKVKQDEEARANLLSSLEKDTRANG